MKRASRQHKSKPQKAHIAIPIQAGQKLLWQRTPYDQGGGWELNLVDASVQSKFVVGR